MSRAERGRISVGVDIGGTKTALLAVALPGVDVLFREVFPTQATLGAAHLRGRLATVLAHLRSELGPHERFPVGVSVPELVDLDGLVATDVVVPGLTGDLKEWAEIGVECVESDVRAAAHAEARVGAGRGFPSFGYMSIGTGISSTFVLGGVAWPGAHGAAILLGSGPFGPKLSPDGRPYPLEELASGPAMVAAYRALGGRARNAQEVLDSCDSDPLAARAVAEAGTAAGQGAALLVNVLDPHALIVGGGLGCVGGPYWQSLEAAARAQIWADAARRIPLLRSGLGPDAAAIGAALSADDAPARPS
jgi:predicted NBD/HSP70 family sugar kinase